MQLEDMTTSNAHKYSSKNPLQRYLIKRFLQNIREFANESQSGKLLDIGSGEGYLLDAVQCANKFQAIALDPNQEALRVLKKKLPETKVMEGVAQKLPFLDKDFDLITCCEVLEHISDFEKALSEIKRVGRSHFIFSVPDEPFFSLANFLRGKNLSRWGNDIEHVNRWSFKKFYTLIGEDFQIIKAKRSFPWTIVFAKRYE